MVRKLGGMTPASNPLPVELPPSMVVKRERREAKWVFMEKRTAILILSGKALPH